jgi:hypothetical protein
VVQSRLAAAFAADAPIAMTTTTTAERTSARRLIERVRVGVLDIEKCPFLACLR